MKSRAHGLSVAGCVPTLSVIVPLLASRLSVHYFGNVAFIIFRKIIMGFSFTKPPPQGSFVSCTGRIISY